MFIIINLYKYKTIRLEDYKQWKSGRVEECKQWNI